MNIIATDDEALALISLTKAIEAAVPDAVVTGFQKAREALEFAIEHPVDIAFLDIQMRGLDGIELAKRLKEIHPNVNIVFVTGYTQYATEAFTVRASGYVMKPASKEKILAELENLRSPIEKKSSHRVKVQCFGNFEVFVDGAPLRFKRALTKEVLAYLVDRHGSAVNTDQLCAALFEDAANEDAQRKRIHDSVTDLAVVLKQASAEEIFSKKRNSYSIIPDCFDCDYYDYQNNTVSGINAYLGEYMTQFSWAEMTNGALQ